MRERRGLDQRLWRVFLLQAGLISIAAILGVFAARFILGDVLIKQALRDEAKFYWRLYQDEPAFSRPQTYNLRGYVSGMDTDIPAEIIPLAPGFHRLPQADSGFYIIYITEQYGRTLYLVFDGKNVGELAIFFGLFPLAGVLIVLYLSSWIAYRFSSRAISPILQLAAEIEQVDPSREDVSAVIKHSLPREPDQELRILADALLKLSGRIDAFILRERNFTRDASHELRTPITVIKIAADMLLSETRLDESATASAKRIKRSATDMEELIEALLLLARESEGALSSDPVSINAIVAEECEQAAIVFQNKKIELEINTDAELIINGSEKVVSVLIGNIIRNAWSYTDEGKVSIHIDKARLTVADSGIGIPDGEMQNVFQPFNRAGNKQRGGHGVGLTIVKMLSDTFNWPIIINSELHKGTVIMIDFSHSVEQ